MEFKQGQIVKHKIGNEPMIVLSEGVTTDGRICVRRQTRENPIKLEIWYREDFFYPFELEELKDD